MSTADDAWLDSRYTYFADPKEAFVGGYEDGYRRALEDAADAIDALPIPSSFELQTYDDRLRDEHQSGLKRAARLVRDRAAGVGTKDEPLFACCGEWHSGPPCPCRCGHSYEQHTDSIGCVECKGGSCVKYVGTKDGDDDRPHVHQWIQAQTEWGTPYKYCSCGERYLL